MTKKRACACLALACALILAPFTARVGAGAEETTEPAASVAATASPEVTTAAPTSTASPAATVSTTEVVAATATATAEPTVTATATATTAPTATATATDTVLPTATTTVTATAEPTATTAATATAEPTATTTATATAEPTATAAPTPQPTAEATTTPEPTATVYPTLQRSDTGDDVTNLQIRLIALNYLDGTIEGMPTGIFDENTETAIKLFQKQNACEETGIADDSLQQLLYDEATPAYGGEGGPGGNPGGGMPGGGGMPSGGGSSGGGASGGEMVEEPGGITPGEALTSSHASGDKDMSPYWSVDASVSEDAEQTLTLGGEALDITLADGDFTAVIEDGALTLSAQSGSAWRVNGYALKLLSVSSIAELRLTAGGETVAIPTEDYLAGTTYAALRAKGLVSKDFTIVFALSNGIAATVEAAGDAYPVDGAAMILNQSAE